MKIDFFDNNSRSGGKRVVPPQGPQPKEQQARQAQAAQQAKRKGQMKAVRSMTGRAQGY